MNRPDTGYWIFFVLDINRKACLGKGNLNTRQSIFKGTIFALNKSLLIFQFELLVSYSL